MRTKTQQELIDIIRFEIRGIPLPEGFSVSDEAALMELAKIQDLTHLVYDALAKNGLSCSSSFAMQQYYAAIWRAEQMDHELMTLAELYEAEGIDFMPLKGSVIRPLYPEAWMRTSADIDILFRKQDIDRAKKAVVEKAGFTFDSDYIPTHHEVVTSPKSDVHVELHYSLFSDYEIGKTVRDMISVIWDDGPGSGRILKEGWKHWYEMSDEMFYFYHLAHMAKHLTRAGGCPVRSLIDLWILDDLPVRSDALRKKLIDQSGLGTLSRQMSAMAEAWLGEHGAPSPVFPDVPSEELEQYIFSGSLYGDIDRRTANKLQETGTAKYILDRIFLPYVVLKTSYPILEKHKWLTPFYQVARWTKIFRRKNRNIIKNQAQALIRSESEEVDQAGKINKILGIEHILEN